MTLALYAPNNMHSLYPWTGQLEALRTANYSGLLKIDSTQCSWNLYFYLGRIFYATGGVHPLRAWQRQTSRHCPTLTIDLPSAVNSLGGYEQLCTLHKAGKITREQASGIIQGLVEEVLFDLRYCIKPQFLSQSIPNPSMLLALINVNDVVRQTQRAGQLWEATGLRAIDPNFAPVLEKPNVLQDRTSATVYQNLKNLLDGYNTLRDLALRVNLDVLTLTRSFLPYFQEGILTLSEVEDLRTQPVLESPLIACIDDSLQICQVMGQILGGAGYRYLAIQDPIRGFASLLQQKPDFIFLDLVLPNTNGYEICTQLRKSAQFRETPIIILTGNIIDRVRARLVGANGGIDKPIKADKILDVVHKHLVRKV